MNQLLKYVQGYVKIRVEGYSPEPLLNLCNANQILLWGIHDHDMIYEMYISIKDYKKLRPFARKTRTKILLLEKHGLPFFVHRFRKRKMFFAGLIFSIALVYGLSFFVWNIHLEGNVSQSDEELLEYLETVGVEHGCLKSEITCESIETSLRTKYPNMLWVSAEMRGTRVIIQIKENTDEDIVSTVEEKNSDPVSIITETDGVVESIIVRQGMPLVKTGDEVAAGQTLVEGYYEIKNDAGEIVRYVGVPADADIDLIVTEEYQDMFLAEYETKRYTDKKRLGIELKIFNKIYKYIPKIPYQNYETVEKQKEIHITENFYLPLELQFKWFLEYQPEMVTYTEEELKKTAEMRFSKKYENILQKGVQIIEKDVKININGNLCKVGGRVKLRIPVTTKIPAVVPEISMELSGEGENEI